jgi:SNF2 family DNA or RNA helicase
MNFKPYAYQQYCIDRVVNAPYTGLFLEMGLGKSVISLTAVQELKYRRFEVSKVLVIAPKKVAEATWAQEAKKWKHTQGLKMSMILGTAKQREAAIHAKADVYVVNRENVVWLVEYFKNAWPYDMVIVDESSSFKNPRAKRFKALASMRPHIKRMIILTGTPSPNGLQDLWSQVFLLDGGQRLEKRYTQYRSRYFEPDKRSRDVIYTYKPVEGAYDLIHEKISDLCVSMQAEDYLDLPPILYNNILVQLSPTARKKYEQLEREMLVEVDPETIVDTASAAALSNKLLQLSNGAIYDEDRGVHTIHNDKLEAFLELTESGNSMLVFYQYLHDLARLQEALAKTRLRYRVLKTLEDVEAWNNKELDILLAHPASAGHGLNLQAGGHSVVWFGLSWNLEQYQQANARLHRQGQTERVIVHHLVTRDSRDEDVLEALERKGDVQSYLMQSLKARIEEAKKQNNPMEVRK